ncbi:unnamed protein product [Bemisia tabaci]|uniref:PB1 domain-containing protein n=1 Tax=Bemisia tabaci TaxID=7038 RepID=A0A9P0AA92_BEMTA|nr:unnamed protein product [Bemisia tabaci]
MHSSTAIEMNSMSYPKVNIDQPFQQLDLSGKLIIKVRLGDDVRRIPIHNDDITYDELVLMMQRVFRGKLSSNDDITIKYKDEDGDMITIFDSSDLSYAVQYSRILKLQIFLDSSKDQNICQSQQLDTIQRELRFIRDRVNQLLDTLSVSAPSKPTNKNNSSNGQIKSNTNSEQSVPEVNLASKEFDPLQTVPNADSSTVLNRNTKDLNDTKPKFSEEEIKTQESAPSPQIINMSNYPVQDQQLPAQMQQTAPQPTPPPGNVVQSAQMQYYTQNIQSPQHTGNMGYSSSPYIQSWYQTSMPPVTSGVYTDQTTMKTMYNVPPQPQ